jgi:alginate O-acetyltransferase complex protein AlgI
MNFVSIEFLIFVVCVVPVFFLIPTRWKWLFLLAASVVFYGFGRARNVVWLALPTIAVYFIALALGRASHPRTRRQLLVLGLAAGLSILFLFKYTDFFGRLLFAAVGLFGKAPVYRPLGWAYVAGVSFFSFRLLSYLIDVYRRRLPAEKHAGYFFLYVAYFPQLLMGPIDRAVRFLPELKKSVSLDYDRIRSGLGLIVWGLFKKLAVADRLALFVDSVFASSQARGLSLVFGAYFFAFQIYCDFSGYSDMAIGLSRILGYESVENFRTPYASRSVAEFWSRWHISLSTWLRDYLFLPLAYGVMRRIPSTSRLFPRAEVWAYGAGIVLTMGLAGLWHGAAWKFVLWGLLYGLALFLSSATKKLRRRFVKKAGLHRRPVLHHGLQVFLTFHFVSFAWVLFRAESLPAAGDYFRRLFGPSLFAEPRIPVFHLLLVFLFIGFETLRNAAPRWTWPARLPRPLKIAGLAFFLCLIAILAAETNNEFIYATF